LTWFETPIGCIYMGVRKVDDMVWVRSAEIAYPNLHMISSVTESGREAKYSSAPFMSLWTLPVDSEHSVQFYIRHNTDAPVSLEQQTLMEAFGQYHNDRPYAERQWIAGDVDAQESQGTINVHAAEQLGTLDRGVTLFRKMVRLGIEAVARGEDPPRGYYLTQADVPPTYTNDFVVPASETGIDTSDPAALRAFALEVWKMYQQRSPMEDYREKAR
jgi:hypothetical protein